MALPECKRISFEDEESRWRLLSDGWRQIDVLETWRGKVEQRWETGTPETDDDARDIVSIIQYCRWQSRLFRDPFVLKMEAVDAKVDILRKAWPLRKERIRVIKKKSRPWSETEIMAFVVFSHGTKELELGGWKLKQATVDLIGVRLGEERKGYGARLLRGATLLGNQKRPLWIWAGTQEHNEPAKALYRSLGMEVVRRQRTFHRP